MHAVTEFSLPCGGTMRTVSTHVVGHEVCCNCNTKLLLEDTRNQAICEQNLTSKHPERPVHRIFHGAANLERQNATGAIIPSIHLPRTLIDGDK